MLPAAWNRQPKADQPQARQRWADTAAYLDERLAHATDQAPAVPLGPARTLLQRWSAIWHDEAGVQRRLEWSGWTRQQLIAAATTDGAGSDAGWPLALERLLAEPRCSEQDTYLLRVAAPLQSPWTRFLLPWLNHAHQQLASLAQISRLSPQARDSLLRRLAQRLLHCSQATLLETHKNRTLRAMGPEPQEYRELFERYPVLARQVTEITLRACVAWQRFCEDLDSAWTTCCQRFFEGKDPGPVQSLGCALSDPHEGGREVYRLHWQQGPDLVYKPRASSLECWWQQLIQRLNGLGLDPALPVLRFVDGAEFALFEWVECSEANDSSEVARYFRQCGALMAAAWLYGARDVHMDNLVASAHGPVLVDAEALFAPDGEPELASEGSGAIDAGRRHLRQSALATGFLGFLCEDSAGKLRDIGALRGSNQGRTSTEVQWRNDADGTLQRSQRVRVQPASANRLRYRKREQAPEDWREEIVDGFARCYRLLLSHPDISLPAQAGDIDPRVSRTRIVLRPTEVYAQALRHLQSPALQRHGMAQSLYADSLNQVFSKSKEKPRLWPMAGRERRQLEALDVPVFRIPVSARGFAPGELAEVYLRSGWEAMQARRQRMGDADLQQQLDLIRASLLPSAMREHHIDEQQAPERSALADQEAADLDDADALRTAIALAERLVRSAMHGDNGELTWIAAAHLRVDQQDDRGVSHYLYDGSIGIATFLAAAAKVAERSDLAAAAMAAVTALLRATSSAQLPLLVEREAIGASHGLGSLLIGLCQLSRLLPEEQAPLQQAATRIAALLDGRRVASSELAELGGGLAGAILGLLRLNELDPQADWLAQASELGEILLQRGRALPGGLAFQGYNGIPQAGLLHGQSGPALVLAELAVRSGNSRFAEAAASAWRYEDTLLDPLRQEWPVQVDEGAGKIGRRYLTALCNGAPGIALARCAALASGHQQDFAGRVESALASTRLAGIGPVDHLCCGALGRAEVLLRCAQLRGDRTLQLASRRLAAQVLARRQQQRHFSLRADPAADSMLQPGLFRGLAGVGLCLLRQVAAPELGSPALFELSPTTVSSSRENHA